jgi:hypothetical protein
VPSALPTAVATAARFPNAIARLITNSTDGPGIKIIMMELIKKAQYVFGNLIG